MYASVTQRMLRLRASGPHVLMITSGLLAFVLVFTISSRQSQTTTIALAAEDLERGRELDRAAIAQLTKPFDGFLMG